MNEARRVTDIASPMGVVFGIIPLTNPASTFVFKTLICLKARNALILSCHCNALEVGNRTGEIIQWMLQQHGAPVDLVQWIRQRASRRKTMMFMLVVEASVRAAFVEQLEACGGRLRTLQEKESCAQKIFDLDNHTVQRALVGRSAQFIAQQAGLPCDRTLRLRVIPAAAEEMSGSYGHEKLAPVLSLFTAHGEAECLELCRAILAQEGSGHTAIIHTRSQSLAEQFSLRMPVSRILVNTPGTRAASGWARA